MYFALPGSDTGSHVETYWNLIERLGSVGREGGLVDQCSDDDNRGGYGGKDNSSSSSSSSSDSDNDNVFIYISLLVYNHING